MSATFPRIGVTKRGYNMQQVDDFLRVARRAYEGARVPEDPVLTAESIRLAAFSMKRGGYEPWFVDAALGRLEDAFSERERLITLQAQRTDAKLSEARVTAQVIANRLARPAGMRFKRANRLVLGYRVTEVDQFGDVLMRHFRGEEELRNEDIREVTFGAQRGGYDETQVDLLLDAAIEVMLAVR